MNEVRTIPGRKNIAFVEYEDESASSTARDALHNTKIQDMKIKVLNVALSVAFNVLMQAGNRLLSQRSNFRGQGERGVPVLWPNVLLCMFTSACP